MSLTKHFDDELSYFLRKFIRSSLERGFITNTVPFCIVNSSECRKCLLNSCGARGLFNLSSLKILSDIILLSIWAEKKNIYWLIFFSESPDGKYMKWLLQFFHSLSGSKQKTRDGEMKFIVKPSIC